MPADEGSEVRWLSEPLEWLRGTAQHRAGVDSRVMKGLGHDSGSGPAVPCDSDRRVRSLAQLPNTTAAHRLQCANPSPVTPPS